MLMLFTPALAASPVFLSEAVPFGLSEVGVGVAALVIIYQLVTKVIVPGYEGRLKDFREMMEMEARQGEILDEAIHVLRDALDAVSRKDAAG